MNKILLVVAVILAAICVGVYNYSSPAESAEVVESDSLTVDSIGADSLLVDTCAIDSVCTL